MQGDADTDACMEGQRGEGMCASGTMAEDCCQDSLVDSGGGHAAIHTATRILLHVPQARDMQTLEEPFVIRATLREEALVSKTYPPAAAVRVDMAYEWEFFGPWEEISSSSINVEIVASDTGASLACESLPLASASTPTDVPTPSWLRLAGAAALQQGGGGGGVGVVAPPALLVELSAERTLPPSVAAFDGHIAAAAEASLAVTVAASPAMQQQPSPPVRQLSTLSIGGRDGCPSQRPDSLTKCGSSEDVSRASTIPPQDLSLESGPCGGASARIVLRLVRGRALNALESAFVFRATLKGEQHSSRAFEPAPLIKLAFCMEWQTTEPWKVLQKASIALEVLKADGGRQLAHQNLPLRQGRLTTVGSAFWRDLACSWLRPGQERPAILMDLQVELPSVVASPSSTLVPMVSHDMLPLHHMEAESKSHKIVELAPCHAVEPVDEDSSSGERSGAEESSELEGTSAGGGGVAGGSGATLVVVEVVRGRALSGLPLPLILRATLKKYPLHALIFNSARFPRIDAYFEWRRCEPWCSLRRSRVHLELLTTDGLRRIGCLPGSLTLADAPLLGSRSPVWCKLSCPSLPHGQAQPSLLLSVSVALPPDARAPSPMLTTAAACAPPAAFTSPAAATTAVVADVPSPSTTAQRRSSVRLRERSSTPSSDSPQRCEPPLPLPLQQPPTHPQSQSNSRPHSRRVPASPPHPQSRPHTKSSRNSRNSRTSRRERQAATARRVVSAAAARRQMTTSSASASSLQGPSEGEGIGSGGDAASRAAPHRPNTRAPPTASQNCMVLRRPPPRTPSSAEFFSLRLHCGSVSNLDLLDRDHYKQPDKPFTLSFTWMGRSLNACCFESLSRYQAKAEGIWMLLRGPLTKIREFMHYVEMIRLRLHRGEEELAYTFVDVRTLCNDSSSTERRRERGRHFLVDSQTKEIPEGAGRVRPTVDVSVTIEPAELAPEQLRAAHLHLRSMRNSGACDFFMPYPRSSSASSSEEWSHPPPPTRDSTVSKSHSKRPKIYILPYSGLEFSGSTADRANSGDNSGGQEDPPSSASKYLDRQPPSAATLHSDTEERPAAENKLLSLPSDLISREEYGDMTNASSSIPPPTAFVSEPHEAPHASTLLPVHAQSVNVVTKDADESSDTAVHDIEPTDFTSRTTFILEPRDLTSTITCDEKNQLSSANTHATNAYITANYDDHFADSKKCKKENTHSTFTVEPDKRGQTDLSLEKRRYVEPVSYNSPDRQVPSPTPVTSRDPEHDEATCMGTKYSYKNDSFSFVTRTSVHTHKKSQAASSSDQHNKSRPHKRSMAPSDERQGVHIVPASPSSKKRGKPASLRIYPIVPESESAIPAWFVVRDAPPSDIPDATATSSGGTNPTITTRTSSRGKKTVGFVEQRPTGRSGIINTGISPPRRSREKAHKSSRSGFRSREKTSTSTQTQTIEQDIERVRSMHSEMYDNLHANFPISQRTSTQTNTFNTSNILGHNSVPVITPLISGNGVYGASRAESMHFPCSHESPVLLRPNEDIPAFTSMFPNERMVPRDPMWTQPVVDPPFPVPAPPTLFHGRRVFAVRWRVWHVAALSPYMAHATVALALWHRWMARPASPLLVELGAAGEVRAVESSGDDQATFSMLVPAPGESQAQLGRLLAACPAHASAQRQQSVVGGRGSTDGPRALAWAPAAPAAGPGARAEVDFYLEHMPKHPVLRAWIEVAVEEATSPHSHCNTASKSTGHTSGFNDQILPHASRSARRNVHWKENLPGYEIPKRGHISEATEHVLGEDLPLTFPASLPCRQNSLPTTRANASTGQGVQNQNSYSTDHLTAQQADAIRRTQKANAVREALHERFSTTKQDLLSMYSAYSNFLKTQTTQCQATTSALRERLQRSRMNIAHLQSDPTRMQSVMEISAHRNEVSAGSLDTRPGMEWTQIQERTVVTERVQSSERCEFRYVNNSPVPENERIEDESLIQEMVERASCSLKAQLRAMSVSRSLFLAIRYRLQDVERRLQRTVDMNESQQLISRHNSGGGLGLRECSIHHGPYSRDLLRVFRGICRVLMDTMDERLRENAVEGPLNREFREDVQDQRNEEYGSIRDVSDRRVPTDVHGGCGDCSPRTGFYNSDRPNRENLNRHHRGQEKRTEHSRQQSNSKCARDSQLHSYENEIVGDRRYGSPRSRRYGRHRNHREVSPTRDYYMDGNSSFRSFSDGYLSCDQSNRPEPVHECDSNTLIGRVMSSFQGDSAENLRKPLEDVKRLSPDSLHDLMRGTVTLTQMVNDIILRRDTAAGGEPCAGHSSRRRRHRHRRHHQHGDDGEFSSDSDHVDHLSYLISRLQRSGVDGDSDEESRRIPSEVLWDVRNRSIILTLMLHEILSQETNVHERWWQRQGRRDGSGDGSVRDRRHRGYEGRSRVTRRLQRTTQQRSRSNERRRSRTGRHSHSSV